MKVELVTVKYGGTIPTVQYGNRQLQFEAIVEIEEGDDVQEVLSDVSEKLCWRYEQEEAIILSRYKRGS